MSRRVIHLNPAADAARLAKADDWEDRAMGIASFLGRVETNLRCRKDLPKILRTVDSDGFAQIQNKYRNASPYPGYSKYLDIEPVMKRALHSAYELNLHRSPKLRILDIGTGCGYFPYLCSYFGHEAAAIDMNDVPMYNEITSFFRIDRQVWQIKANEKLPDLGKRFDLVTGFAVCFNGHDTPQLWGPAEWLFFLKDLAANHLTPNGRLAMKLNREPDGTYYSEELRQFFHENGAIVDGERIYFGTMSPFREVT